MHTCTWNHGFELLHQHNFKFKANLTELFFSMCYVINKTSLRILTAAIEKNDVVTYIIPAYIHAAFGAWNDCWIVLPLCIQYKVKKHAGYWTW